MKIGIIGLGLIGGTIAKSLNQHHHICAYDIDKNVLKYALDQQIVDEAFESLEVFLENNNIIYLCLYPEAIISFLTNYKELIKKNTLFIEISGIKTAIIDSVDKLNVNFDIVYSHPIAGRETIGIEFSDKKIFKNGNYVIIDEGKNKKEHLDLTFSLAKEMGFKNISYLTAKKHDEIIAYTSQLTHIISLSLVKAYNDNLNLTQFTGDSYRDLTRIANINIDLWSDLFINNNSFLLEKITDFQACITDFKNAIENKDKDLLNELLRASKAQHHIYLEDKKNES